MLLKAFLWAPWMKTSSSDMYLVLTSKLILQRTSFLSMQKDCRLRNYSCAKLPSWNQYEESEKLNFSLNNGSHYLSVQKKAKRKQTIRKYVLTSQHSLRDGDPFLQQVMSKGNYLTSLPWITHTHLLIIYSFSDRLRWHGIDIPGVLVLTSLE